MKFEDAFEPTIVEHEGIKHEVWVGGQGPPVILMHELDGLTAPCIQLAERLAGQFRLFVPRFFGRVRQKAGAAGSLKGLWHICVRREFVAFKTGTTSPVANWVRALARIANEQSQEGQKVGVVGMCLTGGIVLATVADAEVGAAVAAQPSLPLAVGLFNSDARRNDIGMSQDDIERAASSTTPILTLRFEHDGICPVERIQAINRQLPNSTEPPEFLNGSNEHPTLTAFYREGTGENDKQKSNQAIEATIDFLNQHIRSD